MNVLATTALFMKHVDPNFFGDSRTAATRAQGG